MSDPLSRSFSVLTSTKNGQAIDVLISALDVDEETVRTLAVAGLLQSQSTRGKTEVLRRLEQLTPEMRSMLKTDSPEFSTALQQALIHGDSELRRRGLEFIRLTENYEQFPVLLKVLEEKRAAEIHELAAETIGCLTNRLYEHLRFGHENQASDDVLRNAAQVKQQVLSTLEQECSKLQSISHPEVVVEGILILGEADSFAVRRVLWHGVPECRELAGRLLRSSKHPGVMRLILDYMSKKYTPAKIIDALETRDDPEFVCFLLRWMPKKLSQTQRRNFQQVEQLAWLVPEKLELRIVPEPLQPTLVTFLTSTGLPRDQKVGVQEWLLWHGTPEGREAASGVLKVLDDSKVRNLIFAGLESHDPKVQAWATSQLRKHDIPEAIALLAERLDSPFAEVRQVARRELQSFNLKSLLQTFERFPPEACLRAGKLVQKIDPHAAFKLQQEMVSPIQRNRIRAARAARALGLQEQVLPALITMLEDGDSVIRRTAVEVLGAVPLPEVARALMEMLDDPSPRVRESAVAALQQCRVPPQQV